MFQHVEIYNLHILSNFFLYVGYEINTKKWNCFKIGQDYNDFDEMIEHLHYMQGGLMVGYNNLNLLYPLLHSLIESREIYSNFSSDQLNNLISSHYNQLKSEVFNEVKKPHIKQLDIYKLFNWDNPKKHCDLLKCQISLDLQEIGELSLTRINNDRDVDKLLKFEKINIYTLLKCYESARGVSENSIYKGNDEVAMRLKLSKEYKINLLNHSRVKLAERVIIKAYGESLGLGFEDLKDLGTQRDRVEIKDCILPSISFKSQEFNNLLNKWKQKVVYNMDSDDSESVIFRGIKISYGLGGAHASTSGIFENTEEFELIDADVRGYYPSIISTNRFRPAQFEFAFNQIYDKFIYQRNIELEQPEEVRDELLISTNKMICNSIFGRFNYPKSPLYDPLCFMKITITGQLQMSMLIERLVLAIPSLEVIAVNTDGITCKVPKNKKDEYFKICDNWSKLTGMYLDYEYYSKMFIKDVSNYLAVKHNGEVKRKGCFRIDKMLNENNSERIIPIALSEYFINKKPVMETLKNHNDIKDFISITRVGEEFTLVYNELKNGKREEQILQQTARFIVGGNSGSLHKFNKHTGKQQQILKGLGVQLMNKIHDAPINYGYYSRKVTEIIENIENKQMSLF